MEDKYNGVLRPYDSNGCRRLTEEELRDIQPTHSLIQGPKVRTVRLASDSSIQSDSEMTPEQILVDIIDMLFKISEIPKSQIYMGE